MQFEIMSEETTAAVSHDEKQPLQINLVVFPPLSMLIASLLATQHTIFERKSRGRNWGTKDFYSLFCYAIFDRGD